MTTQLQGPLLRPADAASYIGVSRTHLYRLLGEGRISSPLQVSPKAVAFPKSTLDDFIASLPSTGIGGAA